MLRIHHVFICVIAMVMARADSGLTVGLGLGANQGPLGVSNDNVEYRMPLSLSYTSPGWGFDAAYAYLSRTADEGSVLLPPSPILTINGRPVHLSQTTGKAQNNQLPRTVRLTHRGWGDINIGLTRYFDLDDTAETPTLDMRASLKLPTGNKADGFSNGKMDGTLSTTLGRSLGDWSANLTAGYSWLGRVDHQVSRDVWTGDAYLGYTAFDDSSFGLDYAWTQSNTGQTQASRSLGVTATFRLSKPWRLAINTSRGFAPTDASHDVSASLSYTFQ